MTPSITDADVVTALGNFLVAVLPDGTEVLQGQQNRAPQPGQSDFVIMTHARREQLSSTTHSYDGVDTDRIGRSTGIHFQIDIYGPNSADNAQVISTLLRDAYGFNFLKPAGVAPLYCDDGQQMPLINGEYQYENRWMMRCVLHAAPEITTPAEFADTIVTTLIKAD